jgi:hypothetical protein
MTTDFTCIKCGLSLDTQGDLDQHTSVVHSLYRCEFCDDYLNSETELEEHRQAMHAEEVR